MRATTVELVAVALVITCIAACSAEVFETQPENPVSGTDTSDGALPPSSDNGGVGSGGGGGGGGSEQNCAETEVEAKNMVLPVDIIWFVDTSGSMSFETATVQNNLNTFAGKIASSGLDYHVVMVADNDVCVPPPLGGPNCTDGPRYRHVKLKVGSNDGLEKVIEAYPKFQGFLRANSLKHFVAVSDDNSDKNASWFSSQIASLNNPGFPNGFIFHSIVAFGPIPIIGCLTGAAHGSVYLALTQATGGVKEAVCATDWSPIFAALVKGVTAGTKLPCAYKIPAPASGKTIDPNKVNVRFIPKGGQPQTIPRVNSKADCANKQGWYYDDPANPTMITLCPNTCSGLGLGKITILFGCKTIIY